MTLATSASAVAAVAAAMGDSLTPALGRVGRPSRPAARGTPPSSVVAIEVNGFALPTTGSPVLVSVPSVFRKGFRVNYTFGDGAFSLVTYPSRLTLVVQVVYLLLYLSILL